MNSRIWVLSLILIRRANYKLESPLQNEPLAQEPSDLPRAVFVYRKGSIKLTVCPLNGNCVYSHKADTGSDFCGRPECAYPRLQRKELVRAISELENLQNPTEVHIRKLRRYRAYLRKLV